MRLKENILYLFHYCASIISVLMIKLSYWERGKNQILTKHSQHIIYDTCSLRQFKKLRKNSETFIRDLKESKIGLPKVLGKCAKLLGTFACPSFENSSSLEYSQLHGDWQRSSLFIMPDKSRCHFFSCQDSSSICTSTRYNHSSASISRC